MWQVIAFSVVFARVAGSVFFEVDAGVNEDGLTIPVTGWVAGTTAATGILLLFVNVLATEAGVLIL
jgi:hypothetical protein